jgi:hypothetical protein
LRDTAVDITNDAVRKIDEAIGRGDALDLNGQKPQDE